MIVAKTIKGKGVSFVEGKPGWHGKPFKKGEEVERALAELEQHLVPEELPAAQPRPREVPRPATKPTKRRFSATDNASPIAKRRVQGVMASPGTSRSLRR